MRVVVTSAMTSRVVATAGVVGIVGIVGIVGLGAAKAHADDELTFNGALAVRAQATAISDHALVSTADVAQLQLIEEANLQARGHAWERRLSLLVDASLFGLQGTGYADLDGPLGDGGALVAIDDHDVFGQRPRLVLSEASVRFDPWDHVSLTIGKQRVVWGSGFAVNPTDVLNPARDPTDPSFQRAGVWQARVDVPQPNLTFSAMFVPAVLATSDGVPSAMLAYPAFDLVDAGPRDDELHHALAARVYLLLLDTDVNLWTVWKHRYNDDIEDRTVLNASVSRLVGDEFEAHAEAMLQRGSTRTLVVHECVAGPRALAACARSGRAPLVQDLVDDTSVQPRILVGGRYMPADESLLSLEYLYAADGLDAAQFADLAVLQDAVGDAQRSGQDAVGRLTGASSSSDGLPARFSLDVVRHHYLFASYQKPRILDDLTLQAGVVTALEDLSSIASASATWAPRDWLQFSAFAFARVPSFARLVTSNDDLKQAFDDAADDGAGIAGAWARALRDNTASIHDQAFGQFDATPFSMRAVVEARVFF